MPVPRCNLSAVRYIMARDRAASRADEWLHIFQEQRRRFSETNALPSNLITDNKLDPSLTKQMTPNEKIISFPFMKMYSQSDTVYSTLTINKFEWKYF